MESIPPLGNVNFTTPDDPSKKVGPPCPPYVPKVDEAVPGQDGLYYNQDTGEFCKFTTTESGEFKYVPMTDEGTTKNGYEVCKSYDGQYYEKDPQDLYPGTNIPVLYGPFSYNPLSL